MQKATEELAAAKSELAARRSDRAKQVISEAAFQPGAAVASIMQNMDQATDVAGLSESEKREVSQSLSAGKKAIEEMFEKALKEVQARHQEAVASIISKRPASARLLSPSPSRSGERHKVRHSSMRGAAWGESLARAVAAGCAKR